jgi:hypothetical protein
MGAFVDFVTQLVTEAKVVLRERPRLPAPDRSEAVAVLAEAHADAVLDVAGPALAFDIPTGLAAAEAVWAACWFLLSRQEPATEVARLLPVLEPGHTAAAHLSADVVLRYLPALVQRSRHLGSADVLSTWLANTLRAWPLSGVLADLDEPANALPGFSHPGLDLLYAERLAMRSRERRHRDRPA